MEYPTGQGYAYTQTNYALLGRIIEQLSGTSFADFVARRQVAVADMPHTRFFTDQDIVPNRANPYMSIRVDGAPTGQITNSHLNWPRRSEGRTVGNECVMKGSSRGLQVNLNN